MGLYHEETQHENRQPFGCPSLAVIHDAKWITVPSRTYPQMQTGVLAWSPLPICPMARRMLGGEWGGDGSIVSAVSMLMQKITPHAMMVGGTAV